MNVRVFTRLWVLDKSIAPGGCRVFFAIKYNVLEMMHVYGVPIGKTKARTKRRITKKREAEGEGKSFIPLPPIITVITKIELKIMKTIVIIKRVLVNFPNSIINSIC